MTLQKVEDIVKDYNGGNGLVLKELSAKYKISYYCVRQMLVRKGVYVPQRKMYHNNNGNIAWRLLHTEALLKKILELHENGIPPGNFISFKVKEYFETQKNNTNATTT